MLNKQYYKPLLRAANSFSSYSFREYFVRRIKHEFRYPSRHFDAQQSLTMLQRQSKINQMYTLTPVIIELTNSLK
jgi:hypothetical protein